MLDTSGSFPAGPGAAGVRLLQSWCSEVASGVGYCPGELGSLLSSSVWAKTSEMLRRWSISVGSVSRWRHQVECIRVNIMIYLIGMNNNIHYNRHYDTCNNIHYSTPGGMYNNNNSNNRRRRKRKKKKKEG